MVRMVVTQDVPSTGKFGTLELGEANWRKFSYRTLGVFVKILHIFLGIRPLARQG